MDPNANGHGAKNGPVRPRMYNGAPKAAAACVGDRRGGGVRHYDRDHGHSAGALFAARADVAGDYAGHLATAEKKWEAEKPAGYDMDITIGGRQPGVVHIEVRASTVTKMTRDGVTPSQSRTWEYWTVPEQFETIRQDFDSSETVGGFGAAPGSQTILKADFDPHYGYPKRYQLLCARDGSGCRVGRHAVRGS